MVEILNRGYDECEKCWTGFLYDEEDIVEVPTKVYEEIGFGNKVVAFDTIKHGGYSAFEGFYQWVIINVADNYFVFILSFVKCSLYITVCRKT